MKKSRSRQRFGKTKDSKEVVRLIDERVRRLRQRLRPTKSRHEETQLREELELQAVDHEALIALQTEAQRELEVSRARYADLFDFAPLGYAILDRNGLIHDINQAGVRMLGLGRDLLIKAPLMPLFTKQDGRRWMEYLWRLRQNQTPPPPINLTLTKPADQLVVLQIVGERVRSTLALPHSDFLRIAILDVTAQHRAEEKLRRSEARFRALLEHAAETVTILDSGGFIRYKSSNVTAMLGYSEAEMLGRRIFEFVHPGDLPAAKTALAGLLRRPGAAQTIELRVRRKGGSWRWMEVIGTNLLASPAVDGVVLNSRDITERQQAEQAVRRLNAELESRVVERTRQLTAVNQRLQAIMDGAQIGIIVVGMNGIIASANPAAQQLFGYADGELVGLEISRLLAMPDRPGTGAPSRARAKFPAAAIEVQGRRKDGAAIELDVSLTESVHHGRWQCVAMVQDITQRKRLERELLEAGEHERQRLGHELHDSLGQQLHGIHYLFTLLRNELKVELPSRAREADRLGRHLEHAIELSRGLAHGLQPVSPLPDGLMLTLKELARRSRDMFNVDCRFVCPAPVLIRRHNVASHLYRIAQEAVNNAVKHGEASRIRIRLDATPQRLTLSIRNNGRQFRPPSEKKAGIGLHVMQHRAEAVGGSLRLQRPRGGGLEIVCLVPRPGLNLSEVKENS